jgi:ribosomal protein S18 acetylase RimI-like enzyme
MEHVATLTLAVAAPARRRGVGRRLLRALTPWARRLGVRKLRLDVRAGNDAARALYASEGYRIEGIERDQIRDHDGFEDNVIMALELTDEAPAPAR